MTQPKQEPKPTRPLHTYRFYQMQLAMALLILTFVGCLSDGIWSFNPGMFAGFIGLIPAAKTMEGIRTGKYQTPSLESYSDDAQKIECDYIRNVLISITLAVLLMMTFLAYRIGTHHVSGIRLLLTAVMFNACGWFTYGWIQEAWGIVASCKIDINSSILRSPVSQPTPVTGRLSDVTVTTSPSVQAPVMTVGLGGSRE